LPPPGVLVGGLCVDDGRVGGCDGLRVVEGCGTGRDELGLGDVTGREELGLGDVTGREELGLGDETGREELGLGTGGGRDGLGGDVPPNVGVLT
jgi:hypothetical protein